MTHPLAKKILRWYARHQRDLPWRKTKNPYAIWISEIMLQQTQVQTVVPYYHRFLARYPSVKSLAAANPDEILKLWENLGYYARARHLHASAMEIVDRLQGAIPKTEKELLRLPGIGSYTAAAIASIAYGERVPAVDGNVRRVLCRVFAIRKPLEQVRTQERIRRLAEELVPSKDPGPFNQALMDLGATVCTPREPSCVTCPVRDLCLAAIQGIQDFLPVKKRRPAPMHKEMVAAVLMDRRGRGLITKRKPTGLLGGLWGFPGGERRPPETLVKALGRSVREQLGVEVAFEKSLPPVRHAYTHFRLTVYAFPCRIITGKPRAMGCFEMKWASPDDLDRLALSRVDRKIIAALSAHNWPEVGSQPASISW